MSLPPANKRQKNLARQRGNFLLGKRNRISCGRVVGDCCRRHAVVFNRLALVAKLLVCLANQALDERVVLIGLQQFLKRRLVISRIERDVALQVGKELRLLGIGPLVEDCLRGSDALLRFGLIPAPGSDASLRVLPTELPQVLPLEVEDIPSRDKSSNFPSCINCCPCRMNSGCCGWLPGVCASRGARKADKTRKAR